MLLEPMATTNFDVTFANQVVACALNTYKKLPKKGKPEPKRAWTLLSAVIMRIEGKSELKTVALGTGSKCIGKSKMSPKGDILNDSHAEVLTRRAFLRYLYCELRKAYHGTSEVFLPPDENHGYHCLLRPGITFHLYTSHTPCGDASIFPKKSDPEGENNFSNSDSLNAMDHETSQGLSDSKCTADDQPADPAISSFTIEGHNAMGSVRKRKHEESHHNQIKKSLNDKDDNIGQICLKWRKKEEADSCQSTDSAVEDIHRTGAKCVPGGAQDLLAPAAMYHTIGALRTKPGRGERTESMSCSDKIARWNILGCQGSLLSLFMAESLHFSSVIVGKCPYSEDAMRRAVISRVSPASMSLPTGYAVHQPVLLQATEYEFEFSRSVIESHANDNMQGGKIVPSASAVAWYFSQSSDLSSHDVTVNGKRQGITKGDLRKPQARSSVCSLSLFKCFYDLVENIKPEQLPSELRHIEVSSLHYGQVKGLAKFYQTAWSQLRNAVFGTWLVKSRELLNFHVHD